MQAPAAGLRVVESGSDACEAGAVVAGSDVVAGSPQAAHARLIVLGSGSGARGTDTVVALADVPAGPPMRAHGAGLGVLEFDSGARGTDTVVALADVPAGPKVALQAVAFITVMPQSALSAIIVESEQTVVAIF